MSESKRLVCRLCGGSYPPEQGVRTRHWWGSNPFARHIYCSERCRDAAFFAREVARAKEVLGEWKRHGKAYDKLIDKLQWAIETRNPKAIALARQGGWVGIILSLLMHLFIFPGGIVWLIAYLLCKHNLAQ
ncbi:MAG: hypothetical protein SPK06_02565 [Kiritimatiellia bacterium]|nr:hypothetical protein [Kiritimatiellia bacterium]